MFDKVFQATHPDMMDGAANQQLRDRYLVQGMFVPGKVVLNYSHNERFVIGGAVPAGGPVTLPLQQVPQSAAGKPFLERRELGVVNGFRTLINTGEDGRQEVQHLHMHVMGGPRPWAKG